jgi:hypothetical protein
MLQISLSAAGRGVKHEGADDRSRSATLKSENCRFGHAPFDFLMAGGPLKCTRLIPGKVQ